MAWLRMHDLWTFKPKEVMANKKHLFECKDNTCETGKSLLVKVAATHGGIVNGNYRMYRPDRMQDSVHTWTPKVGFARPVLIGHNERGDVLGRVKTARYVDESYKWAGDFPIIKDSLFYRSDSKKMPLHETVDWIVEHLMEQDGYTGLGYIELGMNITNPDAIGKVLRDEYLTVSVGFKTDSAVCSICKTDWAVDDKCDHKLGDMVDGKPVFLISGNFEYEEVSFVNFPADPFAGTISKDVLTDAASRQFFLGLDRKQQRTTAASMTMTDSLYDADIHHVEEPMPATVIDLSKVDLQNSFSAEIKSETLTAERAQEMKGQLQEWAPDTDELKTKKRSLFSTLNAVISKRFKKAEPAPNETDAELAAAIADPTPKKDGEDKCKCADGSDCACEPVTLDQIEEADRAFFQDEEGLYAEMEVEIDAAVAAGELAADSIKDAKLSSEARKKLKSGTFCGPNRSFPVPDCAHVTAARRLIGRAKVSDSTKSKILACVSRKAKSLGCGGTKDSAPVVPTIDTKSRDRVIKILDKLKLTDGFAATALSCINKLDEAYDGAEPATQSMIRSVTSALLTEWDGDSYLEWAKKQLEEERDMLVLNKAEVADKEEALNTLSAEKAALEKKIEVADTTAKAVLGAYKKGLASQIVMHKILTGVDGYKDLTTEQRNSKIDELAKRHVESLKDMVADILSELKWTDTAATPKEKVIEPGQKVDDNAQVNNPEPTTAKTDEELQAEEAQRQIDLRDMVRFMPPKERRLLFASLGYEAVQPKK
jgi:hypothetical protein